MNTWKVILATMLIFGTGVLTGGLLVRHSMVRANIGMHRSGSVSLRQQPQAFTPGTLRVDFLRRAQRDLELTPEQKARIDDILRRSQERSRKVMEPVAPRLREEVQRTRDEFRDVLTPRQRKQFDAIWKQQQNRPREPRPMMKDRQDRTDRPERQGARPQTPEPVQQQPEQPAQ